MIELPVSLDGFNQISMELLFLICFSPGSLLVNGWLSVSPGPRYRWVTGCGQWCVPKCAGLNSRCRRHQEKSAHRARQGGRCVQLGIRNKEKGRKGSPDTFRWGISSYVSIHQYSAARSQEPGAIPWLSTSCGILHGALGSWHILDLWKTVSLDILSVSQDDISGWRLS